MDPDYETNLEAEKNEWKALARVLAWWPVCQGVNPKTGKGRGPYTTMWTQNRKFKTEEGAIRAVLAEARKMVKIPAQKPNP